MDIQRMPAWKRLGLKLKYANEDVTTNELAVRANAGGNKRKQVQVTSATDAVNGLDEPHHQLKKPRVGKQKPQNKLNKEAHDASSHISRASFPKRKKSVTFTLDTKVEDGESAQTIQFKVPDSPGSTPKKTNGSGNADESTASPRKPKKEKKPKSQRASSSPIVPRKATAALQYLWQFSHQRSAWKFNKNHETWILKHALSDELIPSEYNLSLATYIHGLKSEGARQRLIEQSREALKTEDSPVDFDPETKQSLLDVIEKDGDIMEGDSEQSLLSKDISRARLILLALGAAVQEPHSSVPSNGQTQLRVKKNKSRTSRVEVNYSSSSESDSEDDTSDTSSSSSSKETTPNRMQQPTNIDADLTSSSDSTSASEDADSSKSDTDTTSDSE